jgi:protein O-GlcNAc transferase
MTGRDRRELDRLVRTSADAHHAMGRMLADQGQNELAFRHLIEATRIRPDLAEAFLDLGRLFAAEGQTEPAEIALRRALDLRPGWPEATQALSALPPGAPGER